MCQCSTFTAHVGSTLLICFAVENDVISNKNGKRVCSIVRLLLKSMIWRTQRSLFCDTSGHHCGMFLQLCWLECEIAMACYLLWIGLQQGHLSMYWRYLILKPSNHHYIHWSGGHFESAEWKLCNHCNETHRENPKEDREGRLRHEEINAFLSCLRVWGGCRPTKTVNNLFDSPTLLCWLPKWKVTQKGSS